MRCNEGSDKNNTMITLSGVNRMKKPASATVAFKNLRVSSTIEKTMVNMKKFEQTSPKKLDYGFDIYKCTS